MLASCKACSAFIYKGLKYELKTAISVRAIEVQLYYETLEIKFIFYGKYGTCISIFIIHASLTNRLALIIEGNGWS